MKRYRRTTSGFTLLEVLIVVSVTIAIGGVLFRALNDCMYVQRVAGAHAARRATTGSLTRQLQRDLLSASCYLWDGAKLELETTTKNGQHLVCYVFRGDAISRRQAQIVRGLRERTYLDAFIKDETEPGTQTHEWQAARLRFAARCQPTRQSDVFWIDLLEDPPPRARPPAVRRSTLSFVLPPYATWEQR